MPVGEPDAVAPHVRFVDDMNVFCFAEREHAEQLSYRRRTALGVRRKFPLIGCRVKSARSGSADFVLATLRQLKGTEPIKNFANSAAPFRNIALKFFLVSMRICEEKC
jgi:hypothetical protein